MVRKRLLIPCAVVGCFLFCGGSEIHATETAAASTGGRMPELRQGSGYRLSALSSDEERWYRVFQEGNFLIGGWQDIMRDVLKVFSPEEQHHRVSVLTSLGEKIGREWARDNTVRRIDDGKLRHWGSLLRQAARKEAAHMDATIQRIDHEVDTLLGR